MNTQPPGRVTLLWCPACGRDDRISYLRQYSPHRTPDGKACKGAVEELEYRIPRVPEPLPSLDAGSIRAAVAVEVAIRPGLPHLPGERMTFVGRTIQFRADDVETLASVTELVLRDIAAGLPDAIAPHPRTQGTAP